MTNVEAAIKGLKSLVEVRRKYGDMQTMKDEIECLDMGVKALTAISELSKSLKAVNRYDMDEKVLIGFNMAVAIFNECFGEICALKNEQTNGDLISRKAVLDRWKELSVRGRTEFDQEVMMIPSAENTAEWIPVSERLPEYDEDIIITYKGTMGQSVTNVSYFDGDFRTEDGEGYFGDVIAWMPLPEPYKVDKEEEE